MKKTILFFLIFASSCYNMKDVNYKQKLSNNISINELYHQPIEYFFFDKMYFPTKTIEALNYYTKDIPNERNDMINIYFKDIWSKTKDTLVNYVTIYDRNIKDDRYIAILSTGPDGIMNFQKQNEDTIFIDELLRKIPLYNKNSIYPSTYCKLSKFIFNTHKDLILGIYYNKMELISSPKSIDIIKKTDNERFGIKGKIISMKPFCIKKDSCFFISENIFNNEILNNLVVGDSVILYALKDKMYLKDTILIKNTFVDISESEFNLNYTVNLYNKYRDSLAMKIYCKKSKKRKNACKFQRAFR